MCVASYDISKMLYGHILCKRFKTENINMTVTVSLTKIPSTGIRTRVSGVEGRDAYQYTIGCLTLMKV